MEAWRIVWRNAVAPLLSTNSLECLRTALANDDSRLLQGATTIPPPIPGVDEWEIEAACPLAFCGWQAEGLETVHEAEEFFAQLCFNIDKRLGEPAGCRWFLNHWDESPREEIRRELLVEVERSLALRKESEDGVLAGSTGDNGVVSDCGVAIVREAV